jgi:hypothetical protein
LPPLAIVTTAERVQIEVNKRSGNENIDDGQRIRYNAKDKDQHDIYEKLSGLHT